QRAPAKEHGDVGRRVGAAVTHPVADGVRASVDPRVAQRAQGRVVERLRAIEIGGGDRQVVDHLQRPGPGGNSTVPSKAPVRASTTWGAAAPPWFSTCTTRRSPAVVMETTRAPDGRAMRCVKVPVGALAALGLDMRRAISDAMTMKPATISRPITITSTFSHIGA